MLTSKINNKLFLFLLLISIGMILADKQKCKSIKHCNICPEKNKCKTCQDGYTLNLDKTKCILQENKNKNATSGSVKKSSISSKQKLPSSPKQKLPSSPKQKLPSSPQQKPPSPQQKPPSPQQKSPSPQQKSPSPQQKSPSPQQKSPSPQQKSPDPPKKSPTPSNNAPPTPKNLPLKPQNPPSPSSYAKKSFPAPPQNKPLVSAKISSNNNSLKKAPVISKNPQASALNFITNEEQKSFLYLICKMVIYLVVAFLLIIALRWLFLRRKKIKFGYYDDNSGNLEEKAKVVYIK